jgi:hypothetical protein
MSTEVGFPRSEALQRSSSSECHCGNCAEGDQDSHEAILHRSILRRPDYQPLRPLFGATLVPPCGPRAPKNTKTDQTRKPVGCTIRSASTLSAQFRWWHQRVRAFP